MPPVPTSVGVFGSVFNAGNYLREDGRTLADYLQQAGGPKRGADAGSSFVCCAPMAPSSATFRRRVGVEDARQLGRPRRYLATRLFVPEELDKTTFVQYAKDWTQIPGAVRAGRGPNSPERRQRGHLFAHLSG